MVLKLSRFVALPPIIDEPGLFSGMTNNYLQHLLFTLFKIRMCHKYLIHTKA